MSAIVRARGAARWLLVLLSLSFITAAAAVDADAAVIFVNPVDSKAISGSLRRAKDKGIPHAYSDAQSSPWDVNIPPEGKELTLTVQ